MLVLNTLTGIKMSYTNWSAFLMIALLTSISPGPGAVLTMSHALTHGYRKTVLIIAGQELALISIVLAVGITSGVIILSPTSLMILKIIGFFWIFYIGASKYFSNLPVDKRITYVLPSTSAKRFLTGFLTDITNAKTIIFMMVTIPQFVNTDNRLWFQITIMMFTMVITDTIMMNFYAFAASRLQKFFINPIMFKIQNFFFGTILILLAFGLLFFTT